MTQALFSTFCSYALAACTLAACGASPAQPNPPPPPAAPPALPVAPTFAGTASYDDGTPAGDALITVTNRTSGAHEAVLTTNAAGHFQGVFAPGDYALAVASERGFAFSESQAVPDTMVQLTMSRTCHVATGQATPVLRGTRVELSRYSKLQGDVFFADLRSDGRFALCLPEASYLARLTGATRSSSTKIDLPTTSSLRLDGSPAAEITRAPRIQRTIAADQAGLVADIVRHDARLIGLGEQTHGTAEFVTTRGALTLELARHADLRAMLLEVDAIAAAQVDDYVNGLDVDPAKAVAGLGFWITDTYEFLHFLDELRQYNAATTDHVHVWGIDVQDAELPVKRLIANAATLGISPDDQAVLERVSHDRGKPVNDLEPGQRASLDQLLARLAAPRSASLADLRIAIAARSLTIQLGYWKGDLSGTYGPQRDAGMASIAQFIVTQTGVKRACVWAHNAHIARWPEGGGASMGMHLAGSPLRYYTVGFFMFQGSARAWDGAGKIGVISHPIPPGPPHTVEAAVMAATGSPDIAWVPVNHLTRALGNWLDSLRTVRDLGAVYYGEASSLVMINVRSALDAVVVVKTGHDSSPTPTGIRRAAPT